ncbi:MAG TPA: class I SAM-dependent methyltransferase [Terriglobales bacterium]|nr:class I SAM-dependent methyltransferase [Terriglobales bacterium]
MARNDLCPDAVAYHGQLAGDWERRYRKRSFQARVAVLEECCRGRTLRGNWLDAGCGSGFLSRWLAQRGCRVTGVDAAPEMVEVSMNLAAADANCERLSFRQVETIARLPFAAEEFSGILCSSVLEYLPDPQACLLEFFRVLKPAGLLLVSVPNALSVVRQAQIVCHRLGKTFGQSWIKFLDYSLNQYRAPEFADVLQSCGFSPAAPLPFGGPLPAAIQRRKWGGPLLMFAAEKNVPGAISR